MVSREERVLVERLRAVVPDYGRMLEQKRQMRLVNPDGPAAADLIERLAAISPDERLIEVLISEDGIERLATDIAIACVDCRPEIREARHRAMVRLGERLRNPLPSDLRWASTIKAERT